MHMAIVIGTVPADSFVTESTRDMSDGDTVSNILLMNSLIGVGVGVGVEAVEHFRSKEDDGDANSRRGTS